MEHRRLAPFPELDYCPESSRPAVIGEKRTAEKSVGCLAFPSSFHITGLHLASILREECTVPPPIVSQSHMWPAYVDSWMGGTWSMGWNEMGKRSSRCPMTKNSS